MSTIELQGQLRQLYDMYRTAALNRKYYGHKLAISRRVNLWLELLLAVVASSAIGAWALWKYELGSTIWVLLSGTAAVVAVAKPLLQIPKQIEKYSKLFVGHTAVCLDLQRLVGDVQQSRRFPGPAQAVLRSALDRIKKMAPDDDPKPSRRLLSKYYAEVNREIPVDRLWFPKSMERN